MQVHRTKVDLSEGQKVKGMPAPSKTRYLHTLRRAEGLKDPVEEAVNDLVIVTHSCRSYPPITLIACQRLSTNNGRFPPIIRSEAIPVLTAQADRN